MRTAIRALAAGVLAATLAGGSGAAFAQAERSLDKCQQRAGKEVAAYTAGLQKALTKCLSKIATERIKKASGTAAGAAKACVAALRKLRDSAAPARTLGAKAAEKVLQACAPGSNPRLAHTKEDVLGPGATVAGDAIEAAWLEIPCLGLGGDGTFATIAEWVACQGEAAHRGALRAVHVAHPQANAWLRDVQPAIAALALLGDAAAADALVVLVGARRWVDNGDGTVTDRVTGLQWEKKTDDGGVHDKERDYAWSTGAPWIPDGTAFTAFLRELNGGDTGTGDCASGDGRTQSGGFAGHCDWRLPTIAELRTILDTSAPSCGSGNPCIDPVFGPTVANFYWSATAHATNPNYAWVVGFRTGLVTDYTKTFSFRVRAVRAGS